MDNEQQTNCHTIKKRRKLDQECDSKFLGVIRDALVAGTSIISVYWLALGNTTIAYLALIGVASFASSRIINNGIKKHVIKKKTLGNSIFTGTILTAAQMIVILLGLGYKQHLVGAIALSIISGIYGNIRRKIENIRKNKKSREPEFDYRIENEFESSDQHSLGG